MGFGDVGSEAAEEVRGTGGRARGEVDGNNAGGPVRLVKFLIKLKRANAPARDDCTLHWVGGESGHFSWASS